MIASAGSLHRRYHALVDEIERECRVHQWAAGDIDLWPIARQDLFLDLCRKAGADTAPRRPPFALRAATSLATPLLDLWKSGRDLTHWIGRPRLADSILLGDGVSLDLVNGSWRDRFGEPVIAGLERLGRTCFVMQSGDLERLPWSRPTFAANRVAARAAFIAALKKPTVPHLPDHARAMRLLAQEHVEVPSFAKTRLARRANVIAEQAAMFERILRRVRPGFAFVVTYYAGLGHAFALACRRLGILCIDLQHCPHDRNHRAYRFSKLPSKGYSTIPGLFWTWSKAEAERIESWAKPLERSWHQAIVGGHSQIMHLSANEGHEDDVLPIAAAGGYEREILIALQPIGGRQELWSALADVIEKGPTTWRWWIRRHPASTAAQDKNYARLLALETANIVTGPQAQMQLPLLLGRMDALISLASGAAAEAAMLGVPSFFLDDEARDTFPGLLEGGEAQMVGIDSVIEAIANLPAKHSRNACAAPSLCDTLAQIGRLASDYANLCREDAGIMQRR